MKPTILTLILAFLMALIASPAEAGSRSSRLKAKDTQVVVAPSNPVVLHDHVIVNGDFVRLGDIFANAGEKAEVNVAYAPKPGGKSTFDARWLYRVAKAYGLDWRPMSRLDQVVVRRDSIVIGREEIQDQIMSALAEKGLGEDTQVELSNRMLRIHLPTDAEAALAVEDIIYDSHTNRFTAIITAPAGDPKAKRTRVTGRVHQTTEIPALTKRMRSGEVIGPRDIQWIRVRSKRLNKDALLDAGDLIGKTPKRFVRAGIPIRASEVRRPILVPKNGLVTMILQMPYMTLTAQGKALEDGSDGDVIRISNSKSHQVVEAMVTGANRVSVRSNNQILMN